MKRVMICMLALWTAGSLTACAGTQRAGTPDLSSKDSLVEQVAEQQIVKAPEPVEAVETPGAESAEKNSEASGDGRETALEAQGADCVDVDLTVMGSDLVYATVYQMMVDPDSYEGKTIRMQGNYYASYYEPTGKYYHYVLIRDAMACCAQGMEFVLAEGNGDDVESAADVSSDASAGDYAGGYTNENALVTVTGVFETYTEDGDDYIYCHLRDAQMIVEESGNAEPAAGDNLYTDE